MNRKAVGRPALSAGLTAWSGFHAAISDTNRGTVDSHHRQAAFGRLLDESRRACRVRGSSASSVSGAASAMRTACGTGARPTANALAGATPTPRRRATSTNSSRRQGSGSLSQTWKAAGMGGEIVTFEDLGRESLPAFGKALLPCRGLQRVTGADHACGDLGDHRRRHIGAGADRGGDALHDRLGCMEIAQAHARCDRLRQRRDENAKFRRQRG